MNTRTTAAAGILAVLFGGILTRLSSVPTDTVVSGLVILVVGVAMLALGPAWLLGLIGALAASGWNPTIVSVGRADLQVADIAYVFFVCHLLAQTALRTRAPAAGRGLDIAGLVLAFLAYTGATLLTVMSTEPSFLSISAISWVRLAQTTSLALLAPRAVRSITEVRRTMSFVTAGALVAVASAVVQWRTTGGRGLIEERYSGLQSTNTLGLVAAFLVCAGASPWLARRRSLRLLMFCAGCGGLLLSKSVAGTAAATIGIAVMVGLTRGRQSLGDRRVGAALVALVVGASLGLAMLRITRPENFPGSSEFAYSSTTHRLIVARAGWEIFVQNPFVGVGWQRSASPSVISSPRVAALVHREFPEANPNFYPDVIPTSVHNAYVQVLAELGMLGFGLFVALLVGTGRAVRRLVKSLREPVALGQARLLSAWLVVGLVWWNDNPLYGGQTETYLIVIALGLLGAIARLSSVKPPRSLEPERAPNS